MIVGNPDNIFGYIEAEFQKAKASVDRTYESKKRNFLKQLKRPVPKKVNINEEFLRMQAFHQALYEAYIKAWTHIDWPPPKAINGRLFTSDGYYYWEREYIMKKAWDEVARMYLEEHPWPESRR